MFFSGSASGVSAKILLDSGASHCFIDENFAEQKGFALHPTNTSVQLADSSEATALLKCHARIHLQWPVSDVTCFVLDMQQQYDVILRDNWLNKYKVDLLYSKKHVHRT